MGILSRPGSRCILLTSLVGALALAMCQDRLDPYFVQVLIFAGINVTLAVSLNLVMGETGQFSLCHAAFMGVGAYASAMLTRSLLPHLLPASSLAGDSAWCQALFLPVLILSGLAAAVAGLLVGIPSLRLSGDYLAIVTLGFGEIIRVFLQNTPALGGARGLEGILPCTNLFWSLGAAAITIYTVRSLIRSTYGRGFLAVRDDEIAAEAMGIDSTKFKVVAFVIGAFFAGVAGALYAHAVEFISPDAFSFLKSIEILVSVILGGMGHVFGVASAAVLLTGLNEWMRGLAEYRMVAYALLIILLMILRPQGLLGGFSRLLPHRK